MRLSKADWDTLDTLLGRIGFGGYYDLIEVLKDIIGNLRPSLVDSITNEKDLYTLIILIREISEQETKK